MVLNMSNPFEEAGDVENKEVLEGFICPICHEDLRALEFLTKHFERAHAEDQDALKSVFKDLFIKAKKTIGLNSDDSPNLPRTLEKSFKFLGDGANQASSDSNSNIKTEALQKNVWNRFREPEIGVIRCHFEDFKAMRNPRLERYASETNKLIIRLHKLLKDLPADSIQRKLHEQSIVTWLDGSSVKLCPNCAKSFHLARRQHHCRLCGSIMCNDCSEFLSIDVAKKLVMTSVNDSMKMLSINKNVSDQKSEKASIRCCQHCLWLIETRKDVQESRNCNTAIVELYALISEKRKDVLPQLEMFNKIVNSLKSGETIFTLNDARQLRGKIGQVAEYIDVQSKRILALQCESGSRTETLQKSVRISCIQFIKDQLLTLPTIPAEGELVQIQEKKLQAAKQRIETERRMAMEAYERYGLQSSGTSSHKRIEDMSYVYGSDLESLENWSAHQVQPTVNLISTNDPLVEQINIIKGYIKQARQDLNFDVVETLELNLRDLQQEFYQRQSSGTTTETTNIEQTNNLNN